MPKNDDLKVFYNCDFQFSLKSWHKEMTNRYNSTILSHFCKRVLDALKDEIEGMNKIDKDWTNSGSVF